MSSSIEWIDTEITCPWCEENQKVSMYIEVDTRGGGTYESIAAGGFKCKGCRRWLRNEDISEGG